MKFSLKIILISFFGVFNNISAQNLGRKDLIKFFNAEKNDYFVINGLPYFQNDSLIIDKKLKEIDKAKISEITYLKNNGKFPHSDSNVIIIQYAELLSQKTIRKKLAEIKPRFKDEYQSFSQHIYDDAKNPVLYFNGKKIHHTECKKIINKLRSKNIGYIYSTKAEQNSEYNGKNAKNGIVIVWTIDKLKQ